MPVTLSSFQVPALWWMLVHWALREGQEERNLLHLALACQVLKSVSFAQVRPKLWLLTRLSFGKGIITLLVYKLNACTRSHSITWGMCKQFWISGPASSLLKHNLHFNKLLGQSICISKLEKYEFQQRNFHLHARYLPFTLSTLFSSEMLNSTDLTHRAPVLSGCWFASG